LRGFISLGLLGLLVGCGDPGPTEAELAQLKAEKDCSKLYSSLKKALEEEFWSRGVKEVKLGERDGFVEQCAKGAYTDEQIGCMDPNLRKGNDSCSEIIKEIDKSWIELQSYLLAPMKEASKDKEKAAPADGG